LAGSYFTKLAPEDFRATDKNEMKLLRRYLQSLENRDRRFDLAVLAGIFVAGLALRLAYIALLRGAPETHSEDPYYYSLIARHLIEGRGYLEIASRAYRPPAYPWLLAGIYSVAGVNLLAARITLAICGGLSGVCAALWVRQLSTRRVGYLAGLMVAVYPQFVRYPQTLYSEAFYLFLLFLGMALLLWALRCSSVVIASVTGVIFGLAALTRETTLMMPAIVGVWLWISRKSFSRRTVRVWLALAAATILVVLPWTVRNYFVLRTFVPIATNSGINFYIGNNPAATGLPDWRLVPGVAWNDGANEVEAHRRGLQEGLSYVRGHVALTVGMWFKKVWLLWRPPIYGYEGLSFSVAAMRLGWLVFYLFTLGFGAFGFVKLWRSPARMIMLLPLLVMICFSIPYVLTFTDTRYRLPMEGFAIFYAMIGFELCLRRALRLNGPSLMNGMIPRTNP
jgi:4-amino-4-deoxy-L-arabinose transferase-like glycosyltransferase